MHDIWGPVVDMPVKFETVRRMALALEKIEEGTSYGTAAFKLKGVLFWRLHQDMESLVVRTDLEQREQMMAADPETYYITDHYRNYPWILVRLARVHSDALRDLIRMAWQAGGVRRCLVAMSVALRRRGRLGHRERASNGRSLKILESENLEDT